MKNFTITFIFITTLFAIVAAGPGKSSSGAPPSHSGAPNEKTCATTGCHDDNPINEGPAELSVVVGKRNSNLEAGKIYSIKIKIADKNKLRFGFQITALSLGSNNPSGKFIITDSLRTKTINNRYELKDRNYVTYTFNGTDAVKKGLGEWEVNWVAPSNINEDIVFYVSAVSANDDMTDKGDRVYTSSYTLTKQKQ